MQAPPFHTYLGIDVRSSEAGRAVATVELEPHHRNLRGTAHGGLITALLDSVLGGAVISAIPPEWWCATTSLATQFIAGTGEGRLTAEGRVVHRGVKVAFAAGEVRDEQGRLVATAHGSWHLWSQRPVRRGNPPPRGRVLVRGRGQPLRVGKIVAAGRNYAKHVEEMHAPRGAPPVLFLKPPSALARGSGSLAVPSGVGEIHHEVELVVLIGTGGKSIRPESALDHVLGYAVGLDLTLRDVQSQAKKRGEPWCVAKGFDGSAPVSIVAPREEVGDGSGLEISLDVNGERRQHSNTSRMLHGVAELIAHASRWMTLERGDLLFTGTPAGVGPLRPGDRVRARIERVGELDLVIETESGPDGAE
jgi:uncharacterized protein (TIGR00369 family)